MKKLLMAGVVSLAALFTNAWADMPDTLVVNQAEMNKLGEGTRTKFVVPVYDIALYTSEGQDVETIVTELYSPMAIVIEVTSGMVTTALFTEVVLDGFKKYEHYDEIKDIVADFLATFTHEIEEGEVYTVFADPIEGLIVQRNGEFLYSADNPHFKMGMFAIWLGDHPVSRRLKRKMLGQRRRR